MALVQMYPAKAGSPETTTTALLSETATEVSVAELSCFPAVGAEGGNLLTLWNDTLFETCLYTAKSVASGAGTLTIVRSGTAHASTSGGGIEWPIGTKIARPFTAYDYDSVKSNIETLDSGKVDIDELSPLGLSLVGETTATSMRDLIAAASSTTATQNIYVDSAATGAGTGADWTNAFTTLAAARDSLPAIINHDVVIFVRKGASAYDESVVFNNVVANGSITIRGEYYWNNSIASAGSSAGKFNVNGADTGIQAGDKVFLMKFTGAVGSSRPDDAFVDSVASVNGTEITLTTRASDTFTTSWYYVIVRTEIKSITVKSDNVDLSGLYVKSSGGASVYITGVVNPQIRYSICESATGNPISIYNSALTATYPLRYVAAVSSGAGTTNCVLMSGCFGGFGVGVYTLAIFSAAVSFGTGRGHLYSNNSSIPFNCCYIKGLSGNADGVLINGGSLGLTSFTIDGYNSSNKLPNGIRAINGGKGITSDVTFGANVTTQKTPANWAATTDGSYIS